MTREEAREYIYDMICDIHDNSNYSITDKENAALNMAIEALTQDAIPVKWLEEKLTGHPELSYSITDGIIAVLDLWKESENKK